MSLKRSIAFILAILMMLAAGCAAKPSPSAAQNGGGKTPASAAPGEEVAMGRYVEKEILPKPYDYVVGPVLTKDGEIAIWGTDADRAMGEIAILQQDGQWRYTPITDQRLAGAMHLSVEPQTGAFILLSYIIEDDGTMNGGVNAFQVTEAGAISELPYNMDDWWQQGLEVSWLVPLNRGGVVIGGQTVPPTRYAADGKKEKELTGDTGLTYALQGDVLYVARMMDGKSIVQVSTQTGEALDTIETPFTVDDYNSAMTTDKDGSLYLAAKQGLYRRVAGGSIWEQLIDGSACSMGDPSLYITCLAITEDDQVYVTIRGMDGGVMLKHYRWDENVAANASQQLNVVSLTESDAMRKAATILQNENPEVKVNVRALIGRDDASTTTQDAVRILNTELLSGKGADVILLDELDVRRYIRKGILMDLTQWAQPQIDSSQWLASIAGSLKNEDGKICSVPSRFTFQTLWGKREELAQISDFDTWLRFCQSQPKNRPAVSLNTYRYWVNMLYTVCSPAWPTDAQGRTQFDSAEFIAFLEGIRAITGNQFVKPKDDMETQALVMDMWMKNLRDEVALMYNEERGFALSDVPYSVNRDRTQGQPGIMVLPGQGGNVFTPVQMLGVNANTTQPELAMQFLDIVFSQQVQDLNFYDGFPIRTASLDKMVEEQIATNEKNVSQGITGSIGMYGYDESLDVYPLSEASINTLRKAIDTLDTVSFAPDSTVMEFVLEETQPFFEGDRSAKEVAQALEKRLAAYLTE